MTIAEPLLLILSSPSGAGKTTLTKHLLQEFSGLRFSVSHTTRSPRNGEVDGKDYHFTSERDFIELIEAGKFAEWARVHGNYYGTHVDEIDRAKCDGCTGLLFDVDYQGARQIKAQFPEAAGIFILPPTLDDLRIRLENRASDDPETINRRFAKAREEIEHYPFFDYLVVNDKIDTAAAELIGIVRAERCKRVRVASIAEKLVAN